MHQQQQQQPKQQEETGKRRRPFSFLQKTVSQDATGIRGGAAASSLKMQSPPLNLYSYGDNKGHRSKKRGTTTTNSGFKNPSRSHRREAVEEYGDREQDLYFPDYEEDIEGTNDYYTSTEEDQDDYPPGEHHLGLLRVPCSIAINSGEDGRYDSYGDAPRGRGGGFDEHYGMLRLD